MKIIKGLDFIDCDGVRCRTFQVLGDDNFTAVAVVDFNDDSVIRFAYDSSIADIAHLIPEAIKPYLDWTPHTRPPLIGTTVFIRRFDAAVQSRAKYDGESYIVHSSGQAQTPPFEWAPFSLAFMVKEGTQPARRVEVSGRLISDRGTE